MSDSNYLKNHGIKFGLSPEGEVDNQENPNFSEEVSNSQRREQVTQPIGKSISLRKALNKPSQSENNSYSNQQPYMSASPTEKLNANTVKALEGLFPNWKWDERLLYWLWLVLQENGFSTDYLGAFNSSMMHAQMHQSISQRGAQLIAQIETRKQNTLLNAEEYDWIAGKGRQPNVLLKYLQSKLGFYAMLIDDLTAKEKLIYYFDIWFVSTDIKRHELGQMRAYWAEQQAAEEKLDWYGGVNEKQKCQEAWNWYREKHYAVMHGYVQFTSKENVLEFLDRVYFSLDEKLYHLSEIKKKYKSWQTQNNNIKKGKKPTNLSLSYESRDQLNELAKKEGKTMSEMVEHLIKEAYTSDG